MAKLKMKQDIKNNCKDNQVIIDVVVKVCNKMKCRLVAKNILNELKLVEK